MSNSYRLSFLLSPPPEVNLFSPQVRALLQGGFFPDFGFKARWSNQFVKTQEELFEWESSQIDAEFTIDNQPDEIWAQILIYVVHQNPSKKKFTPSLIIGRDAIQQFCRLRLICKRFDQIVTRDTVMSHIRSQFYLFGLEKRLRSNKLPLFACFLADCIDYKRIAMTKKYLDLQEHISKKVESIWRLKSWIRENQQSIDKDFRSLKALFEQMKHYENEEQSLIDSFVPTFEKKGWTYEPISKDQFFSNDLPILENNHEENADSRYPGIFD